MPSYPIRRPAARRPVLRARVGTPRARARGRTVIYRGPPSSAVRGAEGTRSRPGRDRCRLAPFRTRSETASARGRPTGHRNGPPTPALALPARQRAAPSRRPLVALGGRLDKRRSFAAATGLGVPPRSAHRPGPAAAPSTDGRSRRASEERAGSARSRFATRRGGGVARRQISPTPTLAYPPRPFRDRSRCATDRAPHRHGERPSGRPRHSSDEPTAAAAREGSWSDIRSHADTVHGEWYPPLLGNRSTYPELPRCVERPARRPPCRNEARSRRPRRRVAARAHRRATCSRFETSPDLSSTTGGSIDSRTRTSTEPPLEAAAAELEGPTGQRSLRSAGARFGAGSPLRRPRSRFLCDRSECSTCRAPHRHGERSAGRARRRENRQMPAGEGSSLRGGARRRPLVSAPRAASAFRPIPRGPSRAAAHPSPSPSPSGSADASARARLQIAS